jgi:hypothetical protein
MKNLFYLFVTISITLIFSSCSTYKYELGTMSIDDQAQKLALLNQQEKRQIQMQSQREPNNQGENDLLSGADKNSLLRLKESRTKVVETLAETNQKRNINVRSYDGYEAAYFYQVVNAGSGTAAVEESSQMNLLLMNKTRKRPSYRSTDPYSVTAMVYLVKPKTAQPGFSLSEAKVIRQVASVRLSAEGKKILQLPIGFYRVDFVYNGEVVYSGPVTLNPLHKVSVSAEDVRGTSTHIEDINACAFINL